MRIGLALLVALAGLELAGGCGVPDRFACQSDVQCVTEMVQGRCEVEGVCSFPDLGCDSGLRFGDRAGELAGMCVGEASSEADGTSSTGQTSATATSTSTPGTTSSDDADVSGAPPEDLPPSTTGPPPDELPYGPCTDDADCIYPDATCLPLGPSSFCGPPCSMPAAPSDECPADPSMIGTPVCFDLGGGDIRCALSCPATMECPPGMTCAAITEPALCIW